MVWNGLAPAPQYGHGPGGWGGWHMVPFGGWGMFVLLIVILVVVVGLVRASGRPRAGTSGHADTGQQETPLEILKKRYARGEIDKQEFERIKQDIVP